MRKKIIITLPVLLGTFILASAQNVQEKGAAEKRMSFAEANRLNGQVEPTVNGKPYSQYKAEQDALKVQAANRQITVAPALPTAPQVAKNTQPEENKDIAKTIPSHKVVNAESNSGITAAKPVTEKKSEMAPKTEVKQPEPTMTTSTQAKTPVYTSGPVIAPAFTQEASKTSNGNGIGETKAVEQKPAETQSTPGNSPAANKTKTD